MSNTKHEKFIFSRMYLTLFVGFLFAAIFAMTYTQGAVEGTLYSVQQVTMRQLMFALVGFSILFLSILGGTMRFDWNNRYEPDPMDEERGWLLYGIIALAGARVVGGFVTMIPLSSIGLLSGSVALTSAIFEEPIFCGIGLLFYSILFSFYIRRTSVKTAKRNANIGSTVVVCFLFAIIHLGVYGISILVMIYLMIGRAIYNLSFLITGTMLTPTVAHVGHNFLVGFLGV
ncbi:MAG: type II CAAX prenyl endopeptidase Rce1 family protein [Candidatus Thorarchaeota archaeon]